MAKPSDMRVQLYQQEQEEARWEEWRRPEVTARGEGIRTDTPDLAETTDDLMEALELLKDAKEVIEDLLKLDKRDKLFTATRRDTLMEVIHNIETFRGQWNWDDEGEGEGQSSESYTFLSCGHRVPLGTKNCSFCLADMLKEEEREGEKGSRPICLACGDIMAKTFTGYHLCPTCGHFDEFEEAGGRGRGDGVCQLSDEDMAKLADPYYRWD